MVVNKPPFHLGVLGEMEYIIDKETPDTVLFIRWEHARSDYIPIIGTTTEAKNEVRPANKRFDATKDVTNEVFHYRLRSKGGPTPPNPNPNPNPTPTPDTTKSSCLITIKNNTQLDLSIAEDPGKRSGDYRTFPADTIPAGGSSQFVFEQTPNSKDQDCEGFVSYEVGSPSQGIWRLDWHNPKNEKNTATGKVEPQTAGFKSISAVGEGDEKCRSYSRSRAGRRVGTVPVLAQSLTQSRLRMIISIRRPVRGSRRCARATRARMAGWSICRGCSIATSARTH